MAKTYQPSLSFFDLPAELRNRIYEEVLIEHTPLQLPYAYEKRPFLEPALLLASRLIRNEASQIFYGGNVFEAPSPASARQFLKGRQPAAIAALRTFRPVDLIAPIESLIAIINRLVVEYGKGTLRFEALSVAFRDSKGCKAWRMLRDVEEFQVIPNRNGLWAVRLRQADHLSAS